ncbi:MAG: bifunctional riboflavin kinase/FAD synthetase [Ignavibacterium sp.]|nr:bifunctional riboflavin kinase/FAD synthetase [Ignavibacterium sp.]MCX7612063.1 bifunctional riboflavin kinase/FAD synthetase [Ignavibacterium sp.]MDW8375295.1 bifunctional riboflavin kinase/FAD synthetase [Ignavibacteriales bacterium]
MILYKDISELKHEVNTVLTIGTFDGIHLGHQEIIKKVVDISHKESLRNLIITFHPHPRKVINPESSIKLLTIPEEQSKILESLGVENHLIINFTKSFSETTSYQFIKDYIVEKIGVKKIVIGYDHHFGKSRQGNVEFLKSISNEFSFEVIEIPPFEIDSMVVSSSLIRNELQNGNIKVVNKMLGRNYSLCGEIISGDGRGRKLGYPTANIKIDEDKALPKLGIYAVFVFIDEVRYNGLLSIGKRPTFYNNGKIVSEVYIYNFDADIYGKFVKVELIEKIREEEKFNSVEELINQMNLDKENGIKIFNSLEKINN